MHRFSVWAPLASRMAVKLNDSCFPMDGSDDQGWWRLEMPVDEAGTNYAFLIDDDPTPYPDPRSPWQPDGVHGMSRCYDQRAFNWTDDKFRPTPLENALIYEVHIGTFTCEGTFDAAIAKLSYLGELGVTHVELMPVAAFAGERGWGYDGVALFAVHQPYGGPDALKRFVDAAHHAGLSVLLDVVYNHFGPVGNYTGKFAPYTTECHRTPWGGAANLEEAGSREVRQFFYDNAIMWLRDYHIDGLRLDAVHAFIDRSAIHFLEQLSIEVEALSAGLGRPLVLIAESDLNDPRIVTPRASGGFGMDAQWSDDFHHALFCVLSPGEKQGYYQDFGDLSQLAKALEETFVYDGIYSRHRGRIHGRPAGRLSRHRFIGFIQNHDQVGNRAIGDRLVQVVGMDRAKIAAAVVLLSPFIPMLFQGEEWAASSPFQYFADHEDPAMARLVSEGRKREFAVFGWNPALIPGPEVPATFERSKLNWEERDTGDHREMLDWYRALVRLRGAKYSPTNRDPEKIHVEFREQPEWFSISINGLIINCNLSSDIVKLAAPLDKQVLLASREGWRRAEDQVVLPSDSLVILG